VTDILISVFANGQQNHGGARRSAQLVELLSETHALALNRPTSPWAAARIASRSPMALARAFGLFLSSRPWGLSLRGMAAFVLYGGWFLRLLKTHRPNTVYLEIGPSLGLVIGSIAAASGVRYLAFPHNIEFLVPGQEQRLFRSEEAALAAEIATYRAAAAVVTISDFDSGVIECLGIAAHTLPYFPASQHVAALHAIKDARGASAKNHYLVLGTVRNPPTEAGMRRLLDLIRKAAVPHQFVVAGYGSESLAGVAPPNVRVAGTVSDAELADLMTRCHGLVLFQPQTSGFLTRITEANLAGIPVHVLGGYRQAAHLEKFGIFAIDDLTSLPDSAAYVLPVPSQAATPWLPSKATAGINRKCC
jgi:hypothetical protein